MCRFSLDNLEKDILDTLKNRERLKKNINLLHWYVELFKQQFKVANLPIDQLSVLEIGSGTSPFKNYYPNIKTSDIMPLDYLDYHFDALNIDVCEDLQNETFDLIIMTNVLHHLKDPILFLEKAHKRLKTGGQILFTEPYYSFLSYPIYKILHHEPSDFSIDRPKLTKVLGPLSTANMAIPYLIFYKRPDWLLPLSKLYETDKITDSFFTGLSYFITGGISKRIPFPILLYPIFLKVDQFLAKSFPRLWASFVTISLKKK